MHICGFHDDYSINFDSEQPKSREEQNGTARLLKIFYRILYHVFFESKLKFLRGAISWHNFVTEAN